MRKKGLYVEEKIAEFLKKKGNTILERNYYNSYGEIDIIYIEKTSNVLVFAEVKYRKNTKFGKPYEYVDKSKYKKIDLGAREFIQKTRKKIPKNWRIDIFSVTADGEVEHLKRV